MGRRARRDFHHLKPCMCYLKQVYNQCVEDLEVDDEGGMPLFLTDDRTALSPLFHLRRYMRLN